MANLEINKLQAQSDDKFVSRASPFGLWAAAVLCLVVLFCYSIYIIVLCMVSTSSYDVVLKLLDTISSSGYLFWVVSFIFGLFGLRGGEKAFTMWRSGKDACPPDEIMTYDTKSKGKVGK